MIFALILGAMAGVGMIFYRGVYSTSAMLNTMGVAIIASFIIYLIFQLMSGIGGFFLKLLLVIVLGLGILYGGKNLWNRYNPSNPIHVPTQIDNKVQSIAKPVQNLTSKIKNY